MNSREKRVFITGITGFVGANVAREFVKKKFEIHAIVRKSADFWRVKDLGRDVKYHFVSLNNTPELKKLLAKINPGYIFHFATHGAYSWQTDFESMLRTNVDGTFSLLEASRDIDYKYFVNTGSSSEYGFKTKPMKENMVLEPNSHYSVTKAAGTHLCCLYAKKHNKPIITLRFFSVYGPYEDKARLIPSVITAALTNTKLQLTSKKSMRDFVYVKDIVRAFVTLPNPKNIKGEIFNIGTGQQYSNHDVALMVNKISKTGLNFQIGGFDERSWDANFWVADISKAKSTLRWSPKFDLEKGLAETYAWFAKNLNFYK